MTARVELLYIKVHGKVETIRPVDEKEHKGYCFAEEQFRASYFMLRVVGEDVLRYAAGAW